MRRPEHETIRRRRRMICKPARDLPVQAREKMAGAEAARRSAEDRSGGEQKKNSNRQMDSEITFRRESLLQPVDVAGKTVTTIHHSGPRTQFVPPAANLQLAARDPAPEPDRAHDQPGKKSGHNTGPSRPMFEQMPVLAKVVADERVNRGPERAADGVENK